MDEAPVQILAEVAGSNGRGTVYLMNDGYLYLRHERTDSATYFRCQKFRAGCSRRIIFYDNGSNIYQGIHGHDADTESAVLYRAKRLQFMNQAQNSQMASFEDVFSDPRNENLASTNPLFNPRRLMPSMIRSRDRILPRCDDISQLSALLRDPRFAFITRIGTSDVLYKGSVESNDGSHVILFLSNNGSHFLKIVPIVSVLNIPLSLSAHQQYEICVVSGLWEGKVIPLAWLLMEKCTYESLFAGFELLKLSLILYRFSQAVCAPNAAASAFSHVFHVEVYPSLFDFIHDIVLCEETSFTAESLKENPALRNIVLLSCALPVLPLDFLQDGINIVISEAVQHGVYNQAVPLFHYIEENWLKSPEKKFSICGNIHRTNYECESLKHKISAKLGTSDDFYSLIRSIIVKVKKADRDVDFVFANRRPSAAPVPLLAQDDVVNLLRYLVRPSFSVVVAVKNLMVSFAEKIQHLV